MGSPPLKKNAGLIADAGLVLSVNCDECDQAHDAPIHFDDEEYSYGWICYELGFVPIGREQLIAFRVSTSHLVTKIAAALACRRRLERPLIEGMLWRIGVFDGGGGDVAVYLTTRCSSLEDARRCATAIAGESRIQRRILLTPDEDGARDLKVAGCTLAKIEDVVSIDGIGGVFADAFRLAVLAGAQTTRLGGRPSIFEPMLSDTIAHRAATGVAAKAIKAEARAIRDNWRDIDQSVGSPTDSTIKRAIRDYRGGS